MMEKCGWNYGESESRIICELFGDDVSMSLCNACLKMQGEWGERWMEVLETSPELIRNFVNAVFEEEAK